MAAAAPQQKKPRMMMPASGGCEGGWKLRWARCACVAGGDYLRRAQHG